MFGVRKFLVSGQVAPFLWIGIELIEFLRIVDVADVMPVLIADRITAIIIAGDDWPGYRLLWFCQHGYQADPIKIVSFRKVAQIDEGRIDIQQGCEVGGCNPLCRTCW